MEDMDIQILTQVGVRRGSVTVPQGTTVDQLLSDPRQRARIGVPEGATVKIDGGEASGDYVLRDGDTAVFERPAADKA